MNEDIPLVLKREIFFRDGFKCKKCGFSDKDSNDLEIHHLVPIVFGGKNSSENLVTLCSICNKYAPDSEKDFLIYLREKIDGNLLNTFRKSKNSISKKTLQGMKNEFNKGKHLTKAPKGYKLVHKQLIPNEDSDIIKNIFEEFLNKNISLTQLAKKNNMTTSGIKKLLQNTTYLGKVKFANAELDGQHTPLLSKHLFEQVQEKLK